RTVWKRPTSWLRRWARSAWPGGCARCSRGSTRRGGSNTRAAPVPCGWARGGIKHGGAVVRVGGGERHAPPSPRLAQLAAQLTAANVDVEVTPDIDAAVWEKFLFIA